MYSDEQFLEFAKKTMDRYEELNLKIDTFSLNIPHNLHSPRHVSLANELMVKAMKLGAVDFDLTLWTGWYVDFTLPDSVFRSEVLTGLSLTGNFKLPVPVIRSETLTSLFLTGDFGMGLKDLTCSKLKSLRLLVAAADADLLRDLFSRFPLLERVKLDYKRMKSKRTCSSGECGYHHKLKYMHLGSLHVEPKFSPSLFSSKFPFLRELVIWNCDSLQNIRSCSQSIERITIAFWSGRGGKGCNVGFDVPNIRKFRFEGSPFSLLDFKTTTSELGFESDIHAKCSDPSLEWLVALNELLVKLSLSKLVSLTITNHRGNCWSGGFNPVAVGSRRPHAVECLTIDVKGVSAAFLDSLIIICRPKFLLVHEDC